MTSNAAQLETRELRETSYVGIGLCGFGGFIFVIFLAVFAVSLVQPPKNKPPAPWAPFVIPTLAAAMVGLGIYFFKKAPVGMRLSATHLELPRLGASIPWTDLRKIDAIQIPQEEPKPPVTLLVMMLTENGRTAIGNKCVTNAFALASTIKPRPDVCLKLNLWSYGKGINSPTEFAADLRGRITSTSTTASKAPPLPSFDSPLELRDVSVTGPNARVYVHDSCGESTVISDSSFHWATNPLRYGGKSICSRCGAVFDNSLHWEDTGESLARFRSRMWRHTPLLLKLLQFLIIPCVIAVIVAIVGPQLSPPAANISPLVGNGIFFFIGFLAANLLIWMTPLAGILPALAGLTYGKYR